MADLRSAFLANHYILVKKLDTEALLPESVSLSLITLHERDQISRPEITGSEKTDRFLAIIHRRAKQKPGTFDELLRLLCESSGQALDDVLKQIKADAADPSIQARFASDVDRKEPISLRKYIEDRIIESLSVDEPLPLLISHGVITLPENALIRSKSTSEEKARELLRIIKSKGKSAYDGFVDALLQSESQVSLGEWLKSQQPFISELPQAAPREVNPQQNGCEQEGAMDDSQDLPLHQLPSSAVTPHCRIEADSVGARATPIVQAAVRDNILHMHLELKHLNEILPYVRNIGDYDLVQLGLALGLHYPSLGRMKRLPMDVTSAWLNREEGVLEKSGDPTYERLAVAMEEIGQNGMAVDVRNQKHAKPKKEIAT